jgi:hypothetical protein
LFILSSTPHSGIYYAKVLQNLFGTKYQIVENTPYDLSLWYKTIFPGTAIGTLTIMLAWFDSAGVAISTSTVFTEANTARGTWTNATSTTTSPAGAAFVSIEISWFGVIGSYIEVDGVSLVGLPPPTPPTTTLFSIRAQDALGNPSPYSSWLIAPQADSILGDPAAANLSLDPANVRIMSSTFVSGVRGVKLSPDGIEGATIVSSTEPVAPFPGMVWIDTT